MRCCNYWAKCVAKNESWIITDRIVKDSSYVKDQIGGGGGGGGGGHTKKKGTKKRREQKRTNMFLVHHNSYADIEKQIKSTVETKGRNKCQSYMLPLISNDKTLCHSIFDLRQILTEIPFPVCHVYCEEKEPGFCYIRVKYTCRATKVYFGISFCIFLLESQSLVGSCAT